MKLRIPPVLQFFLCGALAMLVSHYLPSFSYDSSILKIPAYVIGTAGILILLTAIASFVNARTTVNPHKPETASKLVITGLYRISRNPMYLAMAMLLIAGTFLSGNWAAFIGPVVFVALITHLQIKPEEEVLTGQFGVAYTAYCQQTRRWI
ncbi:MAG: methyltransferase family protein [Maricaulaceae bacterium]